MGTEAVKTEASSLLADPLGESPATAAVAVKEEPFGTQRFHVPTQSIAAFPANKMKSESGIKAEQGYVMSPCNKGSSAVPPVSSPTNGVSICYVFKSRLQEYAQKKSLPTPVYETIKEGPSHEPYFRSTVIVNDVRYSSLPGFYNRKAAEQSAAEVALLELAKSDQVDCISQPIHETGLCKNLLQEYAQKMNFAIPSYQCEKIATPSRAPNFKCTVEIGGIQYIGGAAKTKREAEIKAARTALLAIQSSESSHISNSKLKVIPFRKRGLETSPAGDKGANVPKAKKGRFKKNMPKNKFSKYKARFNNNSNQSRVPGKSDAVVNQAQTTVDGLLPLPAVDTLQSGRLDSGITSNQNAGNASDNRSVSADRSTDSASEYGMTAVDQDVARVNEIRSKSADHSAADASVNISTAMDHSACENGTTTAAFNRSIDGVSTRRSLECNENATKVSGVTQAEA